jgi:fimbrial chaperone protein
VINLLRKYVLKVLLLVGLGAIAPTLVAMTVQPVVIDLSTAGRGMSQVITVENTFATALPVEMRVQDLAFTEDGIVGTGNESEDLLVFPMQALIEPGQTQSFRVQYVGDPELAQSKHFYVTAAQLPVELPEGQSAIQILYNFQVLVSVSPTGAESSLVITGAEIGQNNAGAPVPVITVANGSAAHGYLSSGRLRIIQRDSTGDVIFRRTIPGPEIQQTIGFGLVGAGQTRRVLVPVELPTNGGTIEAEFTPA